jgi:hypothetical protein
MLSESGEQFKTALGSLFEVIPQALPSTAGSFFMIIGVQPNVRYFLSAKSPWQDSREHHDKPCQKLQIQEVVQLHFALQDASSMKSLILGVYSP